MTSAADHRSNNFDALRLVGALVVIFGHAYHIVGRPFENPIVLGYPVQTLGVVIFFVISGYLITASWTRTSSAVGYFAARALRIFPALIVIVLFSVFVLGPWMTTVTTGDYLGQPRTWSYLTNIVLRPQYDLPGVFLDLPYPNAVNGSLWTLPAEFLCYLVVPVVCLLPRALRPVGFGVALAVSLYLAQIPPEESAIVYGSRITDAAGMWVFFAAGALLRLARDWKRDLFRADVAVALGAAYLVFISVAPAWTTRVAWLALPYIVLAVGLASTPYVRRASRFGDLSYGLYLWAFPVQQVVIVLFGVQRMAVNLPLVTGITAMLALLSWHLVEHPSLRLKERLLGRRRRAEPVEERPRDLAPTERLAGR